MAVVTKMTSNSPAGKRGVVVTYKVQLLLESKKPTPVPGQTVKFFHRSDSFKKAALGSSVTNSKGEAVLHYPIPTDAKADNVYLMAEFKPTGITIYGASSTEVRVRIG